jgi:hypothetical protein
MKYEFDFETRLLQRIRRECHFGILEAGAALIATAATAATAAGTAISGTVAGALGGGAIAGAVGDAAVGSLVGAGLGAGEAAITGGDPGKGALGGAISGGVLAGVGGPLGSALGDIGVPAAQTAGDVLAGTAGGTLGAAATGGNLAQGALGGAVSGGIAAYEGGAFDSTAAPSPAGPPTPGAPGTPGVESVTVTAPGAAPPPVTLAGVGTGGQQGTSGKSAASTAAPGTVTDPGVENITVTGSGAGGVPGAAGLTLGGLTPASTGASPLAPAQPTNADLANQAAQQAQQKTGGLGAATSSGQLGLPTESVNVTGLKTSTTPSTAAPLTLAGLGGVGAISGTGGTAQSQDDPNQKKDQSYLDKLGTKTEDLLSNPAVLLGGGLLAANEFGLFGQGGGSGALAGGTQQQAAAISNVAQGDIQTGQQIGNLANNAITQGNQLESYLTSGGMPPGIQAQLDAARAAQEASTRQMYGNLGMGQGNTSLGQDLGNIQQQYSAATAQVAESLYGLGQQQQTYALNLFQQAMNQTNSGADLYGGLLSANLSQDKALSDGVTNFVTSLANMSRPITNYVPAAAASLAA